MVLMGLVHSSIQVTKYVLARVLLGYSSTLKKARSSSEKSGELLPNYTVLQRQQIIVFTATRTTLPFCFQFRYSNEGLLECVAL
jgi:hypothetical protein